MKTFIDTKLYGLLSYMIGIFLIASPYLFNYARVGHAEVIVPITCGAIGIIFSLFTDASFGIVKKIKLSNNFLLDLILGSFLVVSPKIFDYAGYVYALPYLWVGLIKIFASLAAGNILHSYNVDKRRNNTVLESKFKDLMHHANTLHLHSYKFVRNERKSISH